MRFVDRKSQPKPEVLSSINIASEQAEVTKHFRLAFEVRSKKRVPVNFKIWAHPQVRGGLKHLFRDKCAYCESRLVVEPGDVIHFRPPANAQNLHEKKQSSDHYGWFAYEWRNLLLVCTRCARTKANHFPVDGPRASILSSWIDAERGERRLLLDPCVDQPWRHLTFKWDGGVIGKSESGRATIDVLDLNREELLDRRSSVYKRWLDAADLCRRQRSSSSSSSDVGTDEFLKGELSKDSDFSGGLQILLYDAFKAVAKHAGMPSPTRSQVSKNVDVLIKSLSAEQWSLFREIANSRYATEEFQAPDQGGRTAERAAYSLSDGRSRNIASAQITKIHIENFKSVELLSLDFTPKASGDVNAPCAMLLGENSTGKSSVLQAIALCLMGNSLRRKLKLKASDYLPRESKGWRYAGTLRTLVKIEFDTSPAITLEIGPEDEEFQGSLEDPALVVLSYGARRFFGKPAQRMNKISSVRSLFDPLATLNHPGIWLERQEEVEFSAIARATREILALRDDDSIERGEDRALFVRAHGRETPLDRLSDGYRTLFTMAIDIMREMIGYWGNLENARGVVLIDEIETHLHPRWKLRVMSALRRAMPNVQFIVTTHDPLCLRGMGDGEVHVLFRNNLGHLEQMQDLPNVRGLRAEQLLTSDFFGLNSTAEPAVEAALSQLALYSGLDQVPNPEVAIAKEQIGALSLIGDSPQAQIVNEAMRRYLTERKEVPTVDPTQVREEAVRAVLEKLRNFPGKPQE